MDWVEWVFSGVGVTAITLVIGIIFKKKKNENAKQSIKSGDKSTNIQGGNNVKVTIGGKQNEK